jgi:hypothetical protein
MKILLVVSLLLLAAIAELSCMKTKLIEVGKRDQVTNCRLLKAFDWPAGDWIFGTPYTGNFKDEAIEKAEKIGATHILYRSELNGNGIGSTNVVYAYKCPPDLDTFQNKEENK